MNLSRSDRHQSARIEQKTTVFVRRFLMPHSVEEKILELKQRKQKVFDAVVQGSAGAAAGGARTREDFDFLLGGSGA